MKKDRVLALTTVLASCFNLGVAYAWEYSAKANLNQGPTGVAGLATPATSIIAFIKWIGVVVAVVMVIYVGIKYLTAGAGTKADVKGNLLPMLIGAILIGASSVIVTSVFTMVANSQ